MTSNILVLSALLGITSAAKPAGGRNKDWPLWDTKIVLKTNVSTANANDAALVGSYPIGCYRSDGFVGFSQKAVSKVTVTDATNRALYGTTAAHTGTLATTAVLASVNWTCCDVVDNTNCPGRVNTSKVFDGTVWAWNVK
jgi:hypothetical protein